MRDLRRIRTVAPKLQMLDGMLDVYAHPPASPSACAFARTTTCLSADLTRRISPCQFGGQPDCASCGCVASVSIEAIARHRLLGRIQVGHIFNASLRVGEHVTRFRGDPNWVSGVQ